MRKIINNTLSTMGWKLISMRVWYVELFNRVFKKGELTFGNLKKDYKFTINYSSQRYNDLATGTPFPLLGNDDGVLYQETDKAFSLMDNKSNVIWVPKSMVNNSHGYFNTHTKHIHISLPNYLKLHSYKEEK